MSNQIIPDSPRRYKCPECESIAVTEHLSPIKLKSSQLVTGLCKSCNQIIPLYLLIDDEIHPITGDHS